MRVLNIHKFFWHRDGASNYALYLSQLLEGAGHTVVPFAMQNAHNLSSPYERFFVSEMDISDPSRVSLANKIRFAGRMLYSFEAKNKMEALLDQEQFDVVHLHNIYHHISPSILPVIAKQGIPIVMTLHDYKLICPNYTMFHHGMVHEEDCRGWYTSCVRNSCMKESRGQSILATAEMLFHHKIMKYYERYVDRFIAPSQFMIDTCVRHGWDRRMFAHIPHPVDATHFSHHVEDRGYVVYAGRLSEEKGLRVLLDAALTTPDIPYRIVGTGPMEAHLKDHVARVGMHNVHFEGFHSGNVLKTFLHHARIVVLPSIWYENYPLSILEAKAMGKVVIGSTIGGIPEMLPRRMLVRPHDPHALAEALYRWYHASEQERHAAGIELRGEAERVNGPGKHVQAVQEVYQRVILNNR